MTDASTAGGTPVPPVYLHIGAMKTGTSYLQRVLVEHEAQLATEGYLFPGESWHDQIRAAQEVADSAPDDPLVQTKVRGAWPALVQEVLAHDGAGSIVSMEFLSHADTSGARRAVSSLADAEVHVILTVRDATSSIPAQWQTSIRNGRIASWEAYQDQIRRAGGLRARTGWFAPPMTKLFRRTQDIARILEAWSPHVAPERLHVVTVPPSGSDPDLLWRRFAGVIGLDPDLGGRTSRANESLGYASTELLRRVNLELGPVPASDYNATLRGKLSHTMLAPRRALEDRARLDQATYDFALEWNRRSREAIVASGANVVGDLDELPVAPAPHHEKLVEDGQAPPTDAELLAAAEVAADGMHGLVKRRARRAAKAGVDTSGVVVPRKAKREWTASDDPVAAAVTDVAALCRTAIELRRRIRDRA